MKVSLLLIGGNQGRLVAVAIEAARATFAEVDVATAASVAHALERPAPLIPEIIVLVDDVSQAAAAIAAPDESRLSRWAVVALGDLPGIAFAEGIPEAEWTLPILRRVFRLSVSQLSLRRDRERLLGDLLSIGVRVSHDLRTPLGGILSATEALTESLAEVSPDDQVLVAPIAESTQDLMKLIGQMTLWAKASASPEIREPFNMGAMVARVLERLEARVLTLGATVIKPASWPDVLGDPVKSEAAWLGMLDNALRYAGPKPRIEFGWERAEESGYRFWIRDSGPGVPPARRRSLFHGFHRLHEPSAPRGFGLPIVDRLVHLQGGRCGYEPGPDGGSCFYFILPIPPAR
jgi:K+-sensing histidine kinase KdpD